MEYEIIIPAKPIAKSRPRKGKYGNFYIPKRTQKCEDIIKLFASQKIKEPLKGAVELYVIFKLRKPVRYRAKKYKDKVIPCDKRPDLSNYIKTVEDALNGVAYFDDGQVYKITAEKVYAEKDEIIIKVKEVI